ncbi:zinc finger MYM-type protein 1-like [Diabrotica virgifera virgifera]|uniref:DUF4371 domain-containing protein n=1 Tax=Diabrotica virgifera virgifera TaxID=50390 RepID=A0ABM5KRW9_DIAVI|nr:zinc finger MYM-type protein 1-like [Diabrotica virgifera virgifera]
MSCKRDYESGASKRKRKKQKEEQLKKTNKSVESYFLSSKKVNEKTLADEAEREDEIQPEPSSSKLDCQIINIQDEDEVMLELETGNIEDKSKEDRKIGPSAGKSTYTVLDIERDHDAEVIASLLGKENPTDKGHFEKINLSTTLKTFIVKTGSCQPKGPFPKDSKNRSFSSFYYNTDPKAGQLNSVKWLNYSTLQGCAYCLPCWLFSDLGETNHGWVTCLKEWQGLSNKIKTHSTSENHIHACKAFHRWKCSKQINKLVDSEQQSQDLFWAQVLERLFDITLTLAKNSLAFRGSQEHNGNYEGNFLSLVQLLAKYDTVMAQVVSMPKGHTRYLSHDIQNQIINCMSSKLKGKLLENINKARFFSLIVDTTQDLGKKDQLSFVIRYTNFLEELRQDEDGNFEEYKKLSIEESFLGFFHVKDATALGLSTQVVDCLQNLGLDIHKCRGQGYDGASVMKGPYTGVQKRLQ